MTADDTAAQLDALVARLERAAEQLRSGDVSPDAAATLVEDAAALASQASAELDRLARAAADRAEELDAVISRHAHGWTVDRIAPLERAIMRVALLEMLDPELAPGDHPIPPEGAIDEAVEIAKEFCGTDTPGFVNGILGAALRDLRQNQPS